MSDRLFDIRGVQTPHGQRQVQVRELDMNDGGTVRVHEMHLIRPNGDWDYVDGGDAAAAISWLCGDD